MRSAGSQPGVLSPMRRQYDQPDGAEARRLSLHRWICKFGRQVFKVSGSGLPFRGLRFPGHTPKPCHICHAAFYGTHPTQRKRQCDTNLQATCQTNLASETLAMMKHASSSIAAWPLFPALLLPWPDSTLVEMTRLRTLHTSHHAGLSPTEGLSSLKSTCRAPQPFSASLLRHRRYTTSWKRSTSGKEALREVQHPA